jgi:N-acetylneuraminate synthase
VTLPEPSDVLVLKHAVHEVKALLHEARIPLDSSFKVEYSHHYGVQRFREVGAVIIECMNREYCKKLIVQLPRQRHPSHFHTLKEETFQVLYGDLHVDLDGMHHHLVPGQTLLVQPGVWHSFRTDSGVVFEEISTTHHSNDSTYRDKAINQLASSERKTRVDHWGRFQLDEILG